MSATQQLRDSGLFSERPEQRGGSVCFAVIGDNGPIYGASIYVARRGLELHIRPSALENGRFPNNQRLHDFVRRHARGTARGEDNPAHAYILGTEHTEEIIEVIRSGLM